MDWSASSLILVVLAASRAVSVEKGSAEAAPLSIPETTDRPSCGSVATRDELVRRQPKRTGQFRGSGSSPRVSNGSASRGLQSLIRKRSVSTYSRERQMKRLGSTRLIRSRQVVACVSVLALAACGAK